MNDSLCWPPPSNQTFTCVKRTGPRHRAPHHVVVPRGGLVLLATGPLRRRSAPHRAAVDLVLDRDRAERPLREHLHRLRIPVGVLEREVRARDPPLVRVVAADVERLGRDPERRLRVVGIDRGVRHGLGERQVALELLLDQRRVVREHEPARRAARAQLRGPRQRPAPLVHEVVRLAVGDVEDVRAEARVEALDRRPVEVARQREVDRVVGRRGADLPALRVQQPAAVRVVVDVELEADPIRQAHDRLRLPLGRGPRAAVGLARDDLRGALLVVLEVLRVVAVRIDAVGDRRLTVAVVVTQVLTPEPLDVERVLVPVRVHHRDEPQLRRLEQLLGLRVVVRPARRCSGTSGGGRSRSRSTPARAGWR